MQNEIESCSNELMEWLIKWTEKDIPIELIIGIMESAKVFYLHRAIAKAKVK